MMFGYSFSRHSNINYNTIQSDKQLSFEYTPPPQKKKSHCTQIKPETPPPPPSVLRVLSMQHTFPQLVYQLPRHPDQRLLTIWPPIMLNDRSAKIQNVDSPLTEHYLQKVRMKNRVNTLGRRHYTKVE